MFGLKNKANASFKLIFFAGHLFHKCFYVKTVATAYRITSEAGLRNCRKSRIRSFQFTSSDSTRKKWM